MAIHNFVDTITTSVFLTAKRSAPSALQNFYPSQSFIISKLSKYSNQQASNAFIKIKSSTAFLNVDFLHSYNNVNSQNYTGTPNALNIVSYNSGSNYLLSSLKNLNSAEANLYIDRTISTPQYIPNYSIAYSSILETMNVSSSEDTLELDWNVQSDLITSRDVSFDDASSGSGSNGNNQSSLKEFWA